MDTRRVGGDSMKIGIGVEEPSAKKFWDIVLRNHFWNIDFDIRNMKTREKLIREAPSLLETFRNCHYDAGFILVDLHKNPCVSAQINSFDTSVKKEARKPIEERYLFICVVIRELESWFLADEEAINAILLKANYEAPKDTGEKGAIGLLKEMWKKENSSALNKIAFAKTMAPKFNPSRAKNHSASFNYFWTKMTTKAKKQ